MNYEIVGLTFPFPVIWVDTSKKYYWANVSAGQFFDFLPEKKQCVKKLNYNFQKNILEKLSARITSAKCFPLTTIIKINSKKIFSVSIRQTYDKCEITGYVSYWYDITKMIERSKQLKIKANLASVENTQANLILENILSNLPLYIYWKDKDSIFRGCNKLFSKFAGYEKTEDLIGKTDFDVSSKEEAKKIIEHDKEIMKNNKKMITEEIAYDTSGKLVNGMSYKAPFLDQSKCVDGIIGITLDITELKKTQRNLEEALERASIAEKKQKEFLKNQEHDINTAISGIQYAAMELEHAEDLEIAHEAARKISICAGRLKNYNKSLLRDLAWLEDKGRIVEQRISVRKIISNLYELNSLSASNKGLEFTTKICDDMPEFFIGDEIILFQCLQNLVANSIRFTERGQIDISVKILERNYKPDTMLLAFHVKDTGRGIDAKHQRYIFDDFYKVIPSNEPDPITGEEADQDKGRGIGLTLSKKYVEAIKGQIHLHWSEVGKGSEFVITIPLCLALNQENPRK